MAQQVDHLYVRRETRGLTSGLGRPFFYIGDSDVITGVALFCYSLYFDLDAYLSAIKDISVICCAIQRLYPFFL